MSNWVKRGIARIKDAMAKHGPPATPRHLKLAPQPPERLFVKFNAGRVFSLGYFQKDLGNPYQKPDSMRVYVGAPGTVPELVLETAFNPFVDIDGSLGVGVNLPDGPPGVYQISISSVNAYGETFCIVPAFVTVTLV